MKLSLLSICVLSSLQTTMIFASVASFRPEKIAYDALVGKDDFNFSVEESFKNALTQVGMVSITGIFSETEDSNAKKETLAWLHQCITESAATVSHTYPDGTVRRTIATHSIPGSIQPIDHKTTGSDACEAFSENAKVFRSKVAEVTEAFAKRMAAVANAKEDNTDPLLVTNTAYPFNTISEVVENGEHLEHFHSYYKSTVNQNVVDDTIEWHTDQGLFLAFTPGRLVQLNDRNRDNSLTGGFYIKQADGTKALVEFDEHDDLVFLLGDGVNQYINARLEENSQLRATPHSLSMPDHAPNEARVWYGRMVLPPSSAVHPEHGVTFGELREQMLQDNDDGGYRLGCSSNMSPRQLEEITCEGDSIYCWHRCMNASDFFVTEEICAEQDMVMNCTNPRGQLSDGGHGDYYPGCVRKDAVIATPYPTLPEYPRSNTSCTDSAWEQFSVTDGYDHFLDLPAGDEESAGAKFMWSVVDDVVKGRIVYNGLFGFLAVGFAGYPDGAKNGMHGGHVLMGLPGGNYSAVVGLDLTLPVEVNEYIIDPDKDKSSFRYWQDPVVQVSRSGDTDDGATIESTECFTALTFTAHGISGQEFNLTGADQLMWAANGVDYFAGYHGRSRGRFYIDWASGYATLGNGTSPTDGNAPTVGAEPEAATTTAASAAHFDGCHQLLVFIVLAVVSLM